MARVFVGLDWAEDHHDVFVEDGPTPDAGSQRAAYPTASAGSLGSMSYSRIMSKNQHR